MKYFLASLCLGVVTSFLAASDQIPAPPQSGPIALINVTLHPVSGPAIENASIVFDKGKIVAMGADVRAPKQANVVRLDGHHVYPALIEASSQLGLTEVGAVRATRDNSETGDFNPNVKSWVAVNPDSEHFPVTRANGIATAVVMPTGGLISGLAGAMMTDGWTYEDMTLQAPVGLVVNWPNMTIRRGFARFFGSPAEQEKRMRKQLESLDKAFEKAKAYHRAYAAAKNGNAAAPKFDPRLDAMRPVFDGDLPVIIDAQSQKAIRAAVAFSQKFGLKMILLGGYDAPLAADILKRYDIPVILEKVQRLPMRRHDAYDRPFTNALKLHEAGVRFCIGANEGAGNTRNLPYHAATAAAYGLPKDVALKAVTLSPAQILGIADRVGSLEKGKDATLMVTNGDPLEVATEVRHLFIQGRKIDLTSKQTQLFEKYRQKYEQLKGR